MTIEYRYRAQCWYRAPGLQHNRSPREMLYAWLVLIESLREVVG